MYQVLVRSMCEVEWPSVVEMLKFFAREGVFSYVDRIGNALTPEPVEVAIKDALRHLASLYHSSIEKTVETKEGKKVTLRFYRKDEKNLEPLPKIPSQSEVSLFLKAVRKDISCARVTAILAMSF